MVLLSYSFFFRDFIFIVTQSKLRLIWSIRYHKLVTEMKIIRKNIAEKSGEGSVVLQAEESDDMYHLYNLICAGDAVEATSMRNVVSESKSGARDRTRVLTKIMIRVESVDFDSEECALRLKGVNIKENDHLKLGQYHTLTLEQNRPCEIFKDLWDSIHLEALENIAEPTKNADLAVLVMQEGLANLCLIKAALTKNCPKIERDLPKKRQKGDHAHETAMNKFFGDIYESIRKNINFEVVKVVLVGSPGFLRDDFMTYMLERAVREENSVLIKNKLKFVKAHTSSGYRRAVDELLGNPELLAQIGDVKAADEVRALQAFYDMLSVDPDRACYGVAQVQAANEQLAVAELLITDTMYRATDVNERARYVALIESVREHGGRVFQFSSLHGSGEQLNLYTGVAATLRFPLPDTAQVEEGGEDSSEDEAESALRAGMADFDDIADFR